MADLSDIKRVGEEIVTLVRDLFARTRARTPKDDRSREIAVVSRLRKLTAEAGDSTPASLEQRAEAIMASHTALTEVLIEAAASGPAVDDAKLLAIRVQRDALSDALGMLFERAAFQPIPKLLDATRITEIETTLKAADEEIRQRSEAKAVLDNVIDVGMTAARIATRVATL